MGAYGASQSPPPPPSPTGMGSGGQCQIADSVPKRIYTGQERKKKSSVFHVIFLPCYILIRKNKVQPMFSVRGVFFGGLKAP